MANQSELLWKTVNSKLFNFCRFLTNYLNPVNFLRTATFDIFFEVEWFRSRASMDRKRKERAVRAEREKEAKQENMLTVRAPRLLSLAVALFKTSKLLFKEQVFSSKNDTRLAAVEFAEQAKRSHQGPFVLLICEWISTENFCVYRNDKQRN